MNLDVVVDFERRERERLQIWFKVGGLFMGNPTVEIEIEERESELPWMKL